MVATKMTKVPDRLKNYTTRISVEDSLSQIHMALVRHKVQRILFENDEDGTPTGIEFEMRIRGAWYGFRIPARFDGVRPLVAQAAREIKQVSTGERLEEQVQRTAWANIKDWVLAQMALVDAGMVRTEEVFFSYLISDTAQGRRQTTFEAFEEQLMLPEPHEVRRIVTEG